MKRKLNKKDKAKDWKKVTFTPELVRRIAAVFESLNIPKENGDKS